MQLTFEQLPAAVNQLLSKLENIEQLLLERSITPQIDSDEYFTIEQAAKFINLSVHTVYGLVSKQQIPAMKKGKRLYFSKHDLGEWFKTGKKTTITEADSEADNYLTNIKKRRKQL